MLCVCTVFEDWGTWLILEAARYMDRNIFRGVDIHNVTYTCQVCFLAHSVYLQIIIVTRSA